MPFDVLTGDCREVMRTMEDASVDAIVTDPPYGLTFMGKGWDRGVPGAEFWAEALRVAKPGAHLLAFGGTRTFHRLAVAIEDAGWDIRDCVMWVYGSGFPKSHNLDGAWSGWGTALKPAWEPIIVARKPLVGTVAENVLAHGTGALNVDGCRVGDTVESWPKTRAHPTGPGENALYTHKLRGNTETKTVSTGDCPPGRWPANLIHDGSEEVVGLFPESKSGQPYDLSGYKDRRSGFNMTGGSGGYGDNGSAARFFYCAKASKSDRDAGCEALAVGPHSTARNHHPTVKPTDLMRYLCRLVTPPGGVVLDPFTGSGSTGRGAVLEGFEFIGIELQDDYAEIARARIAEAENRAVDDDAVQDGQTRLF